MFSLSNEEKLESEAEVIPMATVNLDQYYTGVIISLDESNDTAHFMPESSEDDLLKVNETLNNMTMEPAETIENDKTYVMVKANCPGRVKVTDKSQIDVVNIDTGMKINQTQKSTLFQMPRLVLDIFEKVNSS